jgi:hypothetical protein
VHRIAWLQWRAPLNLSTVAQTKPLTSRSRGRAVSASLRQTFLILPIAGAGRIKVFLRI